MFDEIIGTVCLAVAPILYLMYRITGEIRVLKYVDFRKVTRSR